MKTITVFSVFVLIQLASLSLGKNSYDYCDLRSLSIFYIAFEFDEPEFDTQGVKYQIRLPDFDAMEQDHDQDETVNLNAKKPSADFVSELANLDSDSSYEPWIAFEKKMAQEKTTSLKASSRGEDDLPFEKERLLGEVKDDASLFQEQQDLPFEASRLEDNKKDEIQQSSL